MSWSDWRWKWIPRIEGLALRVLYGLLAIMILHFFLPQPEWLMKGIWAAVGWVLFVNMTTATSLVVRHAINDYRGEWHHRRRLAVQSILSAAFHVALTITVLILAILVTMDAT